MLSEPDRPRWTAAARRHGSVGPLLVLVLVMGCSDHPAPNEPVPPLPATPFLVSNPVVIAGGARVAYLSLRPGTFGAGAVVTLHSPRGADTSVALPGGGMDPVALPASAGDTLDAAVDGPGMSAPRAFRMVVPSAAPPVVLRTDPADHELHVPLDQMVTVVFSEPMDQASTSGALTLAAGGPAVAGSVSFGAGALSLAFAPQDSLAPWATFVLRIGEGARDAAGEGLTAPFTAIFNTDSLPTPPPPPPHLQVELRRPASGDSALLHYFWVDYAAESSHGFDYILLDLIDATGDTLPLWVLSPGAAGRTDSSHAGGVGAAVPYPAGVYQAFLTVADTLDGAATSAPVTVVLVAGDSTARLQIEDFYLHEVPDPAGSGQFSYQPQLLVSNPAALSEVTIIAYTLLGTANWDNPFPDSYASGLQVPAGQARQLFGESAYGFCLEFFVFDGRRLLSPATARLAYRDAEGHLYETTIVGGIDSLLHAPPPQGSCDHWRPPFSSTTPPGGRAAPISLVGRDPTAPRTGWFRAANGARRRYLIASADPN